MKTTERFYNLTSALCFLSSAKFALLNGSNSYNVIQRDLCNQIHKRMGKDQQECIYIYISLAFVCCLFIGSHSLLLMIQRQNHPTLNLRWSHYQKFQMIYLDQQVVSNTNT